MNFDESIKKITSKAKSLKFFAQKGFSESGKAMAMCGQEIATHEDYPDFVFVICSCMIYKGNHLDDSAYVIYNFNKNGDFIEEVDIKDLPSDFMAKRKPYMKIE